MKPTALLVVVAVLMGLYADNGSAITIKIEPVEFTPGEDDPKISCTLDSKESAAKDIEYIKISRKAGKALVSIDQNNTVSYITASEEEYTASGSVKTGSDVSKSYLDMVVVKPDTEDTGTYTCLVSYSDNTGDMIENKATAHLKVGDPDVTDLKGNIDSVLNKVKEEESEMKEIEENEKKNLKKVEEFEKETENQKNVIEGIMNKEKEVEAKATNVEDTISKKLKKIQELTKKEEVEVDSLKDTIKKLTEKVKKEETEITEIEGKETEDKTKVKNLEEKTEEQAKVFKELDDKEKRIEKEVEDLVTKAKTQLEKVNTLNKAGADGNDRVASMTEQEAQHATMIKNLAEKESNVRSKVNELLQKANEVLAKVRSLKPSIPINTNIGIGSGGSTTNTGADTPIYAVSATNEKTAIRLSSGSNIILPDVIMETGTVYNSQTGIFTAPQRGLYAFHLALKLDCRHCYAKIQALTSSKVLFRLRLGLKYDEDQGSSSAVARLEKGDTVKIMVESVTGSPSLTPGRLCVFSACLVTEGLPNAF